MAEVHPPRVVNQFYVTIGNDSDPRKVEMRIEEESWACSALPGGVINRGLKVCIYVTDVTQFKQATRFGWVDTDKNGAFSDDDQYTFNDQPATRATFASLQGVFEAKLREGQGLLTGAKKLVEIATSSDYQGRWFSAKDIRNRLIIPTGGCSNSVDVTRNHANLNFGSMGIVEHVYASYFKSSAMLHLGNLRVLTPHGSDAEHNYLQGLHDYLISKSGKCWVSGS